MSKRDPNRYPPGFDGERVASILQADARDSDAERAEQIDTAPAVEGTWVLVPAELLGQVRELIDRRR